jgi:hypothetical protein
MTRVLQPADRHSPPKTDDRERGAGGVCGKGAGLLTLQRAAGNREVCRLLAQGEAAGASVQRRFDGDIAGLDSSQVLSRLTRKYGNNPAPTYRAVRGYESSKELYTLVDLASALGLSAAPPPAKGPLSAPAKVPLGAPAKGPFGPPAKLPQQIPAEAARQGKPQQEVDKKIAVALAVAPVVLSPPVQQKPQGEMAAEQNPAAEKPKPVEAVPKPVEAVAKAAAGLKTTYDRASLQEAMGQLFAANNGAPAKQDFISALKALYTPAAIYGIVSSKEFVYDFQAIVRDQVKQRSTGLKKSAAKSAKTEAAKLDAFLSKTEITEVKEKAAKRHPMGDIKRWTLRHYSDRGTDATPPEFAELKSALQLGVSKADEGNEPAAVAEKTKKSGHTGDRDWNKYGNTGNTFFLLFIDAKAVEKQKFLAHAKWYAEVGLGDVKDLWISSDWLDEAAIAGPALHGSGAAVHQALLELGGNLSGTHFVTALMSHFHNLEVKVPGSVPVAEWKKA